MSTVVQTPEPVSFPLVPMHLARQASPLLTACALVLLLVMVPTTLAGLLDTRLFNGINIWIKPLKFQFSLALHLLTVAWAMLALPEAQRQRLLIRGLVWALVVAALFEAGYIAWQASRGGGSHYNLSSAWAAQMYQLMGLGAVTLVVAAAWIGVLILRHGDVSNLLVLGAGLGLLLGGVLGGITGGWMSAQPGHWVGAAPSDAGGLWLFGWSRLGGDLRVAHFFGLHLMQALPILAWLVLKAGIRQGRLVLCAAAVLGSLLTAATFIQAVQGRPLVAVAVS